MQLMGAGDDRLRVGCCNLGAEQEHAHAEALGIDHLSRGLIRSKLCWTRHLTKLADPIRIAREQAPVIGDTDGIDEVEMG